MPDDVIKLSAAKRYGTLIREAARNISPDSPNPEIDAENAADVSAAIDQLSALPQPGSEAWKYSPINRLYEALEALQPPPVGSSATDASELLQFVDSKRYPLAAMTALALQSVKRITASQGDNIELSAPAAGLHWQHIDVPANTEASLLQRVPAAEGSALITTVALAEGATLNHSLNGSINAGTRWHLLSINQQALSNYHLHQLSLGGSLERIDTHVRLLGEGANATLTGALLCGDSDRCDNQTVLEHAAPRCTSKARFHGLANHNGKLTFGGRIHILENGPGTDAQLHNPNLLLSDAAEINTKPELEIYNDDVACAHGATVGQLDADAVFYLRSRGISRAGANALLLRGFVDSAIGGPDSEHALNLTHQRLEAWTL